MSPVESPTSAGLMASACRSDPVRGRSCEKFGQDHVLLGVVLGNSRSGVCVILAGRVGQQVAQIADVERVGRGQRLRRSSTLSGVRFLIRSFSRLSFLRFGHIGCDAAHEQQGADEQQQQQQNIRE